MRRCKVKREAARGREGGDSGRRRWSRRLKGTGEGSQPYGDLSRREKASLRFSDDASKEANRISLRV